MPNNNEFNSEKKSREGSPPESAENRPTPDTRTRFKLGNRDLKKIERELQGQVRELEPRAKAAIAESESPEHPKTIGTPDAFLKRQKTQKDYQDASRDLHAIRDMIKEKPTLEKSLKELQKSEKKSQAKVEKLRRQEQKRQAEYDKKKEFLLYEKSQEATQARQNAQAELDRIRKELQETTDKLAKIANTERIRPAKGS